MKEKSDGELLEIVGKLREDYQKEAVIAAEEELTSRDLDDDQLDAARSDIKRKTKAAIAKASEPLDLTQKVLFGVFCWGVIPWAMAGTFKASGYQTKYEQAWRSMLIGLMIYVIAIVSFVFGVIR